MKKYLLIAALAIGFSSCSSLQHTTSFGNFAHRIGTNKKTVPAKYRTPAITQNAVATNIMSNHNGSGLYDFWPQSEKGWRIKNH